MPTGKGPEIGSVYLQDETMSGDAGLLGPNVLRFLSRSRHPLGFGYLRAEGMLDDARPIELWITCRMTHIASLGALADETPAPDGPTSRSYGEAVSAAEALRKVTGEARYAADLARWWGYADRYLIDHEHGSWHHELDPTNRPGHSVWPGKPDVYHAYQAAVIEDLPLVPSFATALAARR